MYRQIQSPVTPAITRAAACALILWLASIPGRAESRYQDEVLADQPVAYWNLDEPSGGTAFSLGSAPDLEAFSSGRTSNPQLAASPSPELVSAKTFPRTGNQRYAYKIEHEFVAPLNPSSTEGREFTIEAWIRPTAPVFAPNSDKTIVSLDLYGGQAGYFFKHTADGRLLFKLKRNHTVRSSGAKTLPGLITLDTWHHVAVSVHPDADDTLVRFFHNGRPVEAEVDTIEAMQKSDDGVFRIGDRPGSYGVYYSFEGDMDEVAFYAAELADDRLLTHYGLGSHFTSDRWQISRGHEILRTKGLQMQSWMEWYIGQRSNGLDPQTWLDLGTTTQFIYFDPALWAGDPTGGWATSISEGGIARDANGQLTGDVLNASQQPYADRLISLQIGDEILFDDAAEYVSYVRQQYPEVLSYFNFDGHESDGQIAGFQQEADPDLLTFSRYLDPTSSPSPMYGALAQYRRLAAAGNDGTGTRPIPFGQYVRAYNEHRGNRYLGFTGSRVRLSVFSSWTFGAKWISLFKYTGGDVDWIHPNIMLFDAWPDGAPTQAYDDYAEALGQSRRLGSTLTRLQSTDVRFLAGQTLVDGVAVANGRPGGVTDWDSAADPWIEEIRVENLGTHNDQQPGDVVVGYFSPLEEASDGPFYRDEIYFMVLNGLIDHVDDTGPTEQRITLELDFADSGITGVERLDRVTGEVESMALHHLGGSRYEMNLVLDGGAADLFKFATGSCFVGVGDCEPNTWALALGSTLEAQEEGIESTYWFSFFTDPSRRMGQFRNSTGFFYWAEATCIRKTGPHQLIYSAEIQNSSDPGQIGRFVRGFLHDDNDSVNGNDRMILEAPERSTPVDLGCGSVPQEPEHHLGPLGLKIPDLY